MLIGSTASNSLILCLPRLCQPVRPTRSIRVLLRQPCLLLGFLCFTPTVDPPPKAHFQQVPGTHKDDYLSPNLSVVTDFGNMIDISKSTKQRLSASQVPTAAAPTSNGDGCSPQQSQNAETQAPQVSNRRWQPGYF